MTIHFTTETANRLNTWLEKNNFSYTCQLDDEMGYLADIQVINLPFVYDNKPDTVFRRWLEINGLQRTPSIYVMSILHEIGHGETYDSIDAETWNSDIEAIENQTFSPHDIPFSDWLANYWRLTIENEANLWAIDYANNNPDKCKELQSLLTSTFEIE